MRGRKKPAIPHRSVELDGVHYVIIRESVFQMLCKKAKVELAAVEPEEPSPTTFDLDEPSLDEKLQRRRQAAGLSQAELARRAGVRVETLNRIERGKVTPDFATVRKLVIAMNEAEQEAVGRSLGRRR